MNCLKIQDIYDFIEGSLAPERREEMERHLSSCPGCRRGVEDRRLIAGAASGLPPFAVPDGFTDRVMARITPLKIKRPAWLSIFVIATACLAVVSVVSLASGKSGIELIAGVSHSLWAYVKTGAVFTAKAATLLMLAVKALRPLLEAAYKGLSTLTSIIHPAFPAAILVLALGIVVSLIIAMKKKLSLGDEP
jgi:anti-sigma factor RsiW